MVARMVSSLTPLSSALTNPTRPPVSAGRCRYCWNHCTTRRVEYSALPTNWPLLLSHASFVALFAALYHALLGARLLAARRAERAAVRRRLDDAEERARELRLVTTAEVDESRSLLGAVAEVEEVLRGALAVAQAALHPHSVAVFLLSPDGESVRLRECLSQSDRLLRGPLSPREGVLGAVLCTLP